MFTIKLYSDNGYRQRIMEAESFTILRCTSGSTDGPSYEWAEVTLHMKNPEHDCRFDVGHMPEPPNDSPVKLYQMAFIENAAGKTTERLGNTPR